MTSLFSFAEDLVGEGIPGVLDRVRAVGANSITLAASYHQARDIFPHNPDGVIRYLPRAAAPSAPPHAGTGGSPPRRTTTGRTCSTRS